MCLRRRTLRKAKAYILLILLGMVFLAWSNAGAASNQQTQDTINATLSEQTHMNMARLDRLESQLEKTETKVDKINWILGVLSAQLIMELFKLWHGRTGSGSERPPRIYERRTFERDE